jgi:type IV pilus assembly protein PilM
MSRLSKLSGRPRLACEISPDRVLAGRVAEHGDAIEMFATRELPPGCLIPDLTESNVRQRSTLLRAVEETLSSVGGRGRDVVGVIPDAAVRVALLDFEALPPNASEAEGVVRFRLRKSLPFDVDQARVSYHAQKVGDGGVRVVAAVILSSILEEYESLFREAGFSPGVVLPSMLAALGAAGADRPSLVVKVDARTISLAILDQGQLLLFRTLENTRGVGISGEQLAEEVYPSVVFFQDTYHLNLERIFVAGLPDSAGATAALRSQTGAVVNDLVSASQLGTDYSSGAPRWRMAGVVGALVS